MQRLEPISKNASAYEDAFDKHQTLGNKLFG